MCMKDMKKTRRSYQINSWRQNKQIELPQSSEIKCLRPYLENALGAANKAYYLITFFCCYKPILCSILVEQDNIFNSILPQFPKPFLNNQSKPRKNQFSDL